VVNSRRKGNQNVAKTMILFSELGYLVGDVEKTNRFAKVRDLYGLFDAVAVHPIRKPCFIQITSNKPHVHKLYLEFAGVYGQHQNIVQIVYVDRLGFMGYVYLQTGQKTIVDGRKLTQQEFIEKLNAIL
jgi:hypothetical protein